MSKEDNVESEVKQAVEALDNSKEEEKEPDENLSQENKVSPIEEKAREMGWRPKDEWEGDPDEWRDAKEFVDRKPLYEKIDHQNREIKEMRKAINALQGHYQKVRETEYARAMEDLRTEYKKALREGDEDKIIEAQEKMADVKAEQKAAEIAAKQAQKTAPNLSPEFVKWVESNSWYGQDQEMRILADQIGVSFVRSNPEKTAQDMLNYVSKRMRNLYPEKFRNLNRDKESLVDTGSSGSKKLVTKKDDFTLTDEEVTVMKALVRQGVMTEEEYKQDIKKIRKV